MEKERIRMASVLGGARRLGWACPLHLVQHSTLTDSTQSGLQVEAKAQKMNRRRREVRSRRVATHETRNPHDGREQEQKQGRREGGREGEEMRDVRGMKKEGRRGKGSRERPLPLRASPLSLYSTCKRSMKRPSAARQAQRRNTRNLSPNILVETVVKDIK